MTRMPQIGAREIVAFLKAKGFVTLRQSGSHLTLWNEETAISITVPVHKGHDLGRGIVLRILKDSGFTVDDYLNWK